MVAIICDIILILLLIFLVFRLFKFSNADVGTLSKPYLAFVALCMLGVLLSWYLFEKTLKEFRPSQGKSSMFYAGLVSLCLSVPIKIKAIICEKEVAHEIEKPSEVEEVFRPFYPSIRLDGSNSAKSPRKTSIEDAAKDMYKMGMIFTLFGLFALPLSFPYILLAMVILAFVMYFIYRCQAIYIYHWLVRQKYLKLTNLTNEQRYIYPSWHRQK